MKASDSPLVFLSYQWGKQPQIKALYQRLTAMGYSVWMDIYQMGGGDSLYDKIDRGMRGCKAVVSCITQKYSLSANCRREVSLADALKKPIIPLLLEQMKWPPDGPMSMVFTELLFINFYRDEAVQMAWKGEKFDELIGKLEHFVPEIAPSAENKQNTKAKAAVNSSRATTKSTGIRKDKEKDSVAGTNEESKTKDSGKSKLQESKESSSSTRSNVSPKEKQPGNNKASVQGLTQKPSGGSNDKSSKTNDQNENANAPSRRPVSNDRKTGHAEPQMSAVNDKDKAREDKRAPVTSRGNNSHRGDIEVKQSVSDDKSTDVTKDEAKLNRPAGATKINKGTSKEDSQVSKKQPQPKEKLSPKTENKGGNRGEEGAPVTSRGNNSQRGETQVKKSVSNDKSAHVTNDEAKLNRTAGATKTSNGTNKEDSQVAKNNKQPQPNKKLGTKTENKDGNRNKNAGHDRHKAQQETGQRAKNQNQIGTEGDKPKSKSCTIL